MGRVGWVRPLCPKCRLRPYQLGLFAAYGGLGLRSAAPYAARTTLEHARWMIEEFRVSLFAQDLTTVLRVSAKRLEEQFERVVRELNV